MGRSGAELRVRRWRHPSPRVADGAGSCFGLDAVEVMVGDAVVEAVGEVVGEVVSEAMGEGVVNPGRPMASTANAEAGTSIRCGAPRHICTPWRVPATGGLNRVAGRVNTNPDMPGREAGESWVRFWVV